MIGLFLSGIIRKLISAIKWLFDPWYKGALICAVAFASWQTVRLKHANDRADDAIQAAADEIANHRKTKDLYAQAQLDAKAIEESRNAAIETQWENNANATQDRADARIRGALANVERLYANLANRKAAGSPSGRVQNAGTAASAQGADEADRVPLMDERDVRICTANTVNALEWPPFYEAQRQALNAGSPD